MIITLTAQVTDEQKAIIEALLQQHKYGCTHVTTQEAQYIVAVGGKEFDLRTIGKLKGIADVHRVSDAYKLVSKKWKAKPTKITLANGTDICNGNFTIMAGPCSIESQESTETIAKFLSEKSVPVMRGGAFKPRTSPYSFRGHGIEGLKMFYKIARDYGLCIISEVVSPKQIDEMYDYIDIYQVGTRNSQNFDLLHELGHIDKPVMIKRGMSGTLEELLQSAEYVFANGNEKLILCERGIRTYEKAYRNTLDLNAIPVLQEKSHLPVIVDPSHGIGVRRFVPAMALAAKAVGADGIIIEIHERPDDAASDGQQTLDFMEFERLLGKLEAITN
jgi:3-deoxy-7-phosphoheptulonate synthase